MFAGCCLEMHVSCMVEDATDAKVSEYPSADKIDGWLQVSKLERMVKRHESLPGSCIRDVGYDAVATDAGSVSFKPP
jgi:hypothetical protein